MSHGHITTTAPGKGRTDTLCRTTEDTRQRVAAMVDDFRRLQNKVERTELGRHTTRYEIKSSLGAPVCRVEVRVRCPDDGDRCRLCR